jgi:hypothetical protein
LAANFFGMPRGEKKKTPLPKKKKKRILPN